MTPLMSRYLWFRHAAQTVGSRRNGGEWHGSTSRQAVNLVVPPGQVRTTSANRSSRSRPRIRVRCCLPSVCGRYSLYSLFLPIPQPLYPLPFPSLHSALVWFFNLRPVQFALFVLSQAHNLLFFPSSVFVGIWKLKKGRVQSGTHAALCRYGYPGFCCCRCCCCRGCGWRCKVHAAIARHLALD